MSRISTLAAVLVVTCACVLASEPGAEKYWPQWRGPLATGVAPYGDPPIVWSEDKNIRWKVAIPGSGHGAPIIWGERVYILTAIKTDRKVASAAGREDEPRRALRGRDDAGPRQDLDPAGFQTRRQRSGEGRAQGRPQRRGGREGRGRGRGRGGFGRGAKPTNIYQFVVMALDRKTGKTVWQRTAVEELPHEGGHQSGSKASASPVTDGEHLIAFFGSRGLFCYDMQGKLQWKKDLGDMRTRLGFGEGSSPALYGDTVVVTWDHEGDSFIIALDKKTGKQLWKVDRDEHTSWATPVIVEANGKAQVIASATNRIRSYDLATGKEIWQCGGMTANTIPTPVVGHGLLYAISGFRGASLQAIRYAEAKGDITGTKAVVWTHDKGTPYVPSPMLYDDTLYFLDNNRAILSCFDAVSGKPHYLRERLEGARGFYASPVGAAGRVYLASQQGATLVLKRGPKLEVLATNELDDGFDASPAIAGNEIYLRGRKYLYCIAKN